MFPQILLSVDDDRLLNSNHTCWHSAYLTYTSMFLLCLTAHLCLPKTLDCRINGAFMDTSEVPFLQYFDQRHFRFNVSFHQHFWNRDFFFIFQFRTTSIDSCTHSAKADPFLLWDFILFLSFFWAFFFQSHNPRLFSYYDLFLDQFYHNFTITSIVFRSNIYPFYSRRFVTLFALFYFCSTKLNCYQ